MSYSNEEALLTSELAERSRRGYDESEPYSKERLPKKTTEQYRLDREPEREVYEDVEPVDAVVVRGDIKPRPDEPALERQQLPRVERVLWPVDDRRAIGVEVIDEVDEVVRHVATPGPIYIQEVCPVGGPQVSEALEPLAHYEAW